MAAKADVVIRKPSAEDAATLGRLHLAAWREAYTPLLPADFWSGQTEDGWIERWRRNLAAPREGILTRVGVRNGVVVGFATAGPARPNESAGPPVRDRELWAIYVLASAHGSGIADRLLDAVLPDDQPADVWVFEANPRARAFYAKHGFRPDGARHVFGPEWGDQPEIRLVRP